MKKLISYLIDPTDSCSFEQKLYRGLCIISSVGNIGIATSNILNHATQDAIINLFGVVISFLLFYFARFKNKYLISVFYSYLIILSIISYYVDFAVNQATPYTCLITMVILFCYSPVKWHLYIAGFNMVMFISFVSIDLFIPEFFKHSYKTGTLFYIDLIFGIMTTIVFCFTCFYFLRKSYEDEREKNLRQQALIEKINQQKSMFFINLSHEIKTPLTLIENYLDKYIVTKGEDDELLTMKRNVNKLRKDILNYMNFEKFEQGHISFKETEQISFSTYLEEKINLFSPFIENKCIEVNNAIEQGINIEIDPHGIDQVLNNLLENAVKYTPENGQINIKLERKKDSAIFTIQNSGNEIPEDQLSHLFEPFYQLSGKKLNSQGIGMGLYITKKIIENSGGWIRVESIKNKGITVTIFLPAINQCPVENIPQHSQPVISARVVTQIPGDSPYITNRPNLLLVEDHHDLLSYLCGELSNDYNIYTAVNGVKALQKLEKIPIPDLIISDIMMDEMDGYELLQKTITDNRFAHIPFIFLTAKDKYEEKISAIKLGAIDYITKPFTVEELKTKIKSFIEYKKRIKEITIKEFKQLFSENYFSKDSFKILNDNIVKYRLTEREKEIITNIRKGLKYEEIARKLYISEHTVIRHVQNIYRKTDSKTKIEMLQKIFEVSDKNLEVKHS